MLYNRRNNVSKAFENKAFPFKDGFQKYEPDLSDEDWVRVDKKRFNSIKNNVKRIKDENKFVVAGGSGSRIYVNDVYQLIQDREHDGITHEEALKKISKICDDIKKIISQKTLNSS